MDDFVLNIIKLKKQIQAQIEKEEAEEAEAEATAVAKAVAKSQNSSNSGHDAGGSGSSPLPIRGAPPPFMTTDELSQQPAVSHAIASSVTSIAPPSLTSLDAVPSKMHVRDPLQRHVESAASSAVPKEENVDKKPVEQTKPSLKPKHDDDEHSVPSGSSDD
jgi:hypothetical protein